MFELVKAGKAAGIYADRESADVAGLRHVAKKIQADIELVTGVKPSLDEEITDGYQIVAGTIGKSPVIDDMLEAGEVDLKEIQGKRECYAIRLVGKKLVVAGTETVATLHGLYHISSKIGVSPWVYWADVKPAKKEEIVFDNEMKFTGKEPSVRFRGFFMNDEWPSLGRFVMNTFGDFNVKFYDAVFDLLLRLKGNYFWPAMWSASLSLDGSKEDPLASVRLATDLGITIGNSHHEPLMRSSEEWDKVKTDVNNEGYGKDWNYYTNGEGLYRYWEDGVERNKEFKHMITIGMRGERDTTMLPEGSSIQENVELLRRIITDQMAILEDKGCMDMPKMLALYKEVEDYYYGGNGVKGLKDWDKLDDTILLLSDDNFANVRTLPTAENRDRKAGWGLYYHFDYHGSPISYEWVNSTPLPKVWEQLTMAYEYGIKDLWIVNVGDIRPDELPLSYYMALAYDYDRYGIDHPNSTGAFLEEWVEEQFGSYVIDEEVKKAIVAILKAYTRVHGNRRPEAVHPDTYHAVHYGEADQMIALCDCLIAMADDVYRKMPKECSDTYYGLVYYPAVAGANVQLMNLYAAKNAFYAENGVAAAADFAHLIEQSIAFDQKLTEYYNQKMAGGKWDGMMSSAHVCFEHWNDEGWHYPEPKEAVKPEGKSFMVLPDNGDAFVSEGTVRLPEFTDTGMETYFIQIAGCTDKEPECTVTADCDAVMIDKLESGIPSLLNYAVSIKWDKVKESGNYKIAVKGGETEVCVEVPVVVVGDFCPENTFVETDSVVAFEAEHVAENIPHGEYEWKCLKEYGKTLSSMKVYPMNKNFDEAGNGPSLMYRVFIRHGGEYTLRVITAPTNNLEDGRNMRYAVSVDENEPEMVSTLLDEHYNIGAGHARSRDWAEGVLNNCHYGENRMKLEPGLHTIRVFGVEAGLVLQKLVLYKEGAMKESYFGPTESSRVLK